MGPLFTQDYSLDLSAVHHLLWLSSTHLTGLSGGRSLSQFDWLLLASSGLAVFFIAIFLGIISVLLWLIWRRSRARRAQGPARPESDQTIPSPSPNPQAVSASAEVTLPSRTSEDAHATQPRPASTKQRPPQIKWQVAGRTDVGRKRDMNEDQMLIVETEMADGQAGGLYVIADGMGGHEQGEVASRLTIDTIRAQFDQVQPGQAPYEDWLEAVIRAANDKVISHQSDKLNDKKMGSTLVMAFVTGQQAHIANVGDSRAYHLSNDAITQISVDHSLVERLIQIGQITREEARTHKQRNVIYSTIGDKAKLQIGLYHVDLRPGDRLLLCSDGLSDMLTDEQILNINRTYVSPVEACEGLVKAANAAGGEDNITAILIEIDLEGRLEVADSSDRP
jgi:protein phosphatase